MIYALALFTLQVSSIAPTVHPTAATDSYASASPRVLHTLEEIHAALPETRAGGAGDDGSGLSPSTLLWLDHLSDDRQMTVAMLSILAYQTGDRVGGHRQSDTALGALALAAQIAAGGASTGTRGEHVIDTGGSANRSKLSASPQGKAALAMAWGKRLGISEGDFLGTLRSLPEMDQHASGPDFRVMLRRLGAPVSAP